MGLDMYMYRKLNVKNWSFHKPEENWKITVRKGGKIYKQINPEKIEYLQEEIGYWRKANAIHQWFVENCGEGEDNCEAVWVSKEKLQELLGVCKKIQASLDKSGKKTIKVKTGWNSDGDTYDDIEVYTDTSLAEELLPTQEGFFFGGTEYGECYYQDLVDTQKILEEALKNTDGDFYYKASW